jgi:ATP-dependent DNA helicase DinG
VTACLITPAAWTGVDLPGLIDHLVITRLPLVPPDEAAAQAYENWFVTKGGSKSDARGVLLGRTFSAASRKLAQGIGRAVRQAEDRVHVWIADSRMPISPAVVARKFGMTQGLGDVRFIPAIPKRFRLGPVNAFDRAEIFPASAVSAAA